MLDNPSAVSDKPQLLLFSATVPSWVRDTAERYMGGDKVVVDLIGRQTLRTAVTVEHKAICCPYSERASTIADIIQVRGLEKWLHLEYYLSVTDCAWCLVLFVNQE